MEKGILTVHSAGNNGFAPKTVTSVAPWLLTVGASSMDRGIVAKVRLGNGKTIVGKAVNSFKMNGTEFPLVYGKDVTNTCNEFSARLCITGCLSKDLVKGKIVLCDRNSGISTAFRAGAAGAIAKSGKTPDVSFVVPMPASVLLPDDLNIVKNYYINSTKEAKAVISTSQTAKNSDAPVIASFSSKGPNPIIPDLLKPDITAPGVEILAAYSPSAPVSNDISDKRSAKYKLLSGTSMSCPHVAGAAAYVKSAHPDWSTSAIKSALMTTAWPMDPKKHKDAEFSYGSGHLNPINATNPGLIYETSKEDYIKMLCNMGYSTQAIKRLFKENSIDCSKLTTKDLNYPSMTVQAGVATKDLNYPSMTVQAYGTAPYSASFSRTVTNVGPANSTYTAKITKISGCNITVEPTTLLFKQLKEKKSFVVTVKCDQVRSIISASLVWSDGNHTVRSPIVVY